MDQSKYDQAEICVNGHVTNHSVRSHSIHSMKFCDKCGAKTIRICPACSYPLRGRLYVSGVFGFDEFRAPSYCHECGNKMPWAESGLNAARRVLIELDMLEETEVDEIVGRLELLLSDGPRSVEAANRLRNTIGRLGTTGSAMLKEVAVSLITETSRRLIWG